MGGSPEGQILPRNGVTSAERGGTLRAAHTGAIVVSHLAALALTVYTMRTSGVRTEVLLYAFIMLCYFTFALANVNAEGRLGSTTATILNDVNAAITVAAIYWVNALLTRALVIQPKQPLVDNLGYNTRELSLLAVSILLGSAIFLVRKNMGYPASAWTVMGPLLVLRTITDLAARLAAPHQPRTGAVPASSR